MLSLFSVIKVIRGGSKFFDSIPIDSVVVLIHSRLQASLEFGARGLNFASYFRKWIQCVFDVTVVDCSKHNFNIDFFSFLEWNNLISFEQRKNFNVRSCNISINIIFFHRTNLSDPMAPTLESFPSYFSVRPEQLLDSIYGGVDHHLVPY